jgi:hypothetical protein
MWKCRVCYDEGYIWSHPSGSDDDKPRFEKCDACGVLESDTAAKVKASSRSYFVVWWHGYVTNENGKPTTSEIMQDDMTIDNGYSEEDLVEINSLKVGDKYSTGGPIEEVTIYRWK